MRILLYSIFTTVLTGCYSLPDGNDSTGVEHRYVPVEDFARISEYFTGKEDPGGRLYLRTNPEAREGYYWIVATPKPLKEKPARIDLRVHVPGSPETRKESFSVEALDADTLWIGITGSDWPAPDTRPIAWQLVLKSASGESILEKASYLWTPTPSIEPETSEPQ